MERVRRHKVALGLGNNVDYEIEWNTPVIESLVEQYRITAEDIREYAQTGNERDLVCSILHCLSNGLGREVYVRDSEIVEAFSRRFARKVTMGGTCIRAAIAMANMGASAAMHLVTMNDDVRAQLPPNCDFVCSNDRDSSFPHLVIQYKAGIRIRVNGLHLCSPLANRIIYTNDRDNMLIRINESYGDLIDRARIFLISGFNVIVDFVVLDERIDALLRLMRALPKDALVFYESACFFNPSFNRHVIARLRGKIDIFSMNEEEMQQMLGRPVDLMDAAEVERALGDLRGLTDVPYVLIHTHLWAAIAGDKAARFDRAIASAVNLATTRYRFGDTYTIAQYRSTLNMPKRAQAQAFLEALVGRMGEHVFVAPVPVVPETDVTTIGLGDCFVGGFMLPFA